MDINYDINISLSVLIYTSVNPSSYILYEIEIVLLLLSFISATVFAYVLWHTKTFHRNVRVLFINLAISTYGYGLSRFYCITNDFSKNFLYQTEPIISYIFVFCDALFLLMFTINQLGVVTERIFATIYSNSYERIGYLSTFLVFLVPWTVNFATKILVRFVNLALYCYILLGCNLITWMSLLVLFFVNRIFYKNVFNRTLSEKYQIAENIRTVRVLIIYVSLTAIRNSISMVTLFIREYYSIPSNLYQLTAIMNHTLRFAVCFYSLLYPFALIYAHKDLKKKFKELFRLKSNTADRITTPTNALGQRIIMSNNGEEYFLALQNNWSKENDKKRSNALNKRTILNKVFPSQQ